MSQAEVRFGFNDGTVLTTKQLGYLSFRWSSKMAEQDVAEFSPDRVGALFPVAKAISAAPLDAHLYLTALNAAAYLTYLTALIGITAEIMDDFFIGLKDSISEIRTSNDQPLSPNIQKILVSTVARLGKMIHESMEKQEQPGALNPRMKPYTQFVLECLLRNYSDGDENLKLSDVVDGTTYGISHLLDSTPLNLMRALQLQGLQRN